MSDSLGKGAGDYMRDYASRMFANNDDPDAVANLAKLLDSCEPPGPVLPMDKVVMGREAIEELARLTQRRGYHTPGPHATDPMGVITGIQIVESDVLDPDQWIAYDRNGRILAMGRSGSVKILVGRDPT